MAENEKPSSFIRGLGVWDASALVVGCVIGAGIFRLSDSVAKASPSPGFFLLAWGVGGLISLCGALCYAELSTLFPKNGGDYIFLTRAYGRPWGFIFGWTKLFVQRTGTVAIISYIFAEHACLAFGLPHFWVKLLATGAILFVTTANILGLRYGKDIQNIFTSLKVVALFLIILAGAAFRQGSMAHFSPFWPEWTSGLLSQMGVALIFVLWTYGGWENAAYVAEEVKDPRRNLPLALIGGILAVTGLYLLVNFIYLYYLPLPEMRATDLVAAGTMEKILPRLGGRVVAAMVMVSTLGGLNGMILATSRVLNAMGQDHALFRWLGRVHPATHTPVQALAAFGLGALLLVWTGTLDKIVTYTEVIIYLFFGMSGISLFLFRRKLPAAGGLSEPRCGGGAPSGGEPPGLVPGVRGAESAPAMGSHYRVWGYPWTPIVFILMCFAFAANAVAEQPVEALAGIGVAGLGLPLYLLSERLRKS